MRAGFDDRLGEIDDQAPFAGLGVLPDRPNTLWISWISRQQGCDVGAKGFGNSLQNGLGIALEASFYSGQARMGKSAD